jgi:hypothetical protein
VTLNEKTPIGWIGAQRLCNKVQVAERCIYLSSYGEWVLYCGDVFVSYISTNVFLFWASTTALDPRALS